MKAQQSREKRSIEPHDILARQGLRLPPITLKRLQDTGIYCQPTVSIEHQHLVKRYVIRGVESGGAVAELGAYASFVDGTGEALSWLQRVDSIAVNGVHAIVVEPVLVRLEMVRIQRTYDLLITRHSLAVSSAAQRPQLESSILFHGRRGSLEMKLWSDDMDFRGAITPVFYSRSGEVLQVPPQFRWAVAMITAGVCCVGCRHCHLLRANAEPLSSSSADSPATPCFELK